MNSLGCNFMEEGINFDLDTVCDCCISHNDGRGLPILLKDYHGELIDWEHLFDVKEKRINAQKQCTIWDCEGCYKLEDYEYKGRRKISEFHFSHSRACNAKCIYCSDLYSSGTTNYNTYPVIKDLIEKGYYAPGGEATMEGGEPTLMQNFDELVHLLTSNGTRVRVHTSAIKYSDTVEEALKNNMGTVVISLDSSYAETYRRIKQVNAFDIVCTNIKRYMKASFEHPENVVIKYVLIPGYNDTPKEIKNFLKQMKEFGVARVAIDIEVQYARRHNNKDVSEHVYLLVDYFNHLAKKYKLDVLSYSFLSYVLKNRTISKAKFLDKDWLFGLYLKKYTDISKNIRYTR